MGSQGFCLLCLLHSAVEGSSQGSRLSSISARAHCQSNLLRNSSSHSRIKSLARASTALVRSDEVPAGVVAHCSRPRRGAHLAGTSLALSGCLAAEMADHAVLAPQHQLAAYKLADCAACSQDVRTVKQAAQAAEEAGDELVILVCLLRYDQPGAGFVARVSCRLLVSPCSHALRLKPIMHRRRRRPCTSACSSGASPV